MRGLPFYDVGVTYISLYIFDGLFPPGRQLQLQLPARHNLQIVALEVLNSKLKVCISDFKDIGYIRITASSIYFCKKLQLLPAAFKCERNLRDIAKPKGFTRTC